MKPTKTKDGRNFRPPEGWNQAVDGKCGDLSVRIEQKSGHAHYISTWKPSEVERLQLMAGACVELTCVGLQPPVAVNVCSDPAEGPTEEDRRRWANDMRDGM